jgi:hypothetical protein
MHEPTFRCFRVGTGSDLVREGMGRMRTAPELIVPLEETTQLFFGDRPGWRSIAGEWEEVVVAECPNRRAAAKSLNTMCAE